MKTTIIQIRRYLNMAALALAGALASGCDNTEIASMTDPETAGGYAVTLTTTLSFDEAQTRTLTDQGVKTFAEGDKFAVLYWHKDLYRTKVETAPLQAADITNGGRTAKISVVLNTPRSGTSDIKIVYPASLASRDYDDGIDIEALRARQDGTFANIAQWDAGVATTDLTISNGVATLNSNLSLQNPFCIVGFTLTDDNATALNSRITDLDITAGAHNYNIRRTASSEPIFLAMKPVNNEKVTITFKDGDDYYSQSVTTTLSASNIYPVNATLRKINPNEIPLTIKAAAMGTISFTLWAGASMYSGSDVKYTRNGVYEGIINNRTSANIPVSAGDEISFYGNNSVYYQYDGYGKEQFSRISCGVTPCFVYGNIMSLVNGLKKYSEDPDESITSDFASATELADLWNTFNSLFRGNSYLMSHSLPLVLPATKLTDYCYMNMFTECYGLTKAPELPATTLARGCYAEMFSHCWKLVKGPSELPATEMKEGSCRMMFYDCEKLASAPVLRATTLAGSCYRYMFSQCKELTRAPDLIATTLESECYVGMFKECSKLNYVKCLATGGLTDANTSAWLTDVSQTGTFVKASSADVSQIAIPSGWTVTTE